MWISKLDNTDVTKKHSFHFPVCRRGAMPLHFLKIDLTALYFSDIFRYLGALILQNNYMQTSMISSDDATSKHLGVSYGYSEEHWWFLAGFIVRSSIHTGVRNDGLASSSSFCFDFCIDSKKSFSRIIFTVHPRFFLDSLRFINWRIWSKHSNHLFICGSGDLGLAKPHEWEDSMNEIDFIAGER